MPRDATPTLYSSLSADGALAEVAFHWSRLTPVPRRPATLHRLTVRLNHVLRLARADLLELGVAWDRYGEIEYARTQAIG